MKKIFSLYPIFLINRMMASCEKQKPQGYIECNDACFTVYEQPDYSVTSIGKLPAGRQVAD